MSGHIVSERQGLLAAGAGVALWAMTFAVPLPALAQLTLPLRIAGLSLLAYAVRAAHMHGPRRLLLSPPLHMAGLLLLFYSFLPLLSAAATSQRTGIDAAPIILGYPGSAAEGMILGLVCLCIALHLTAAILVRAFRRELPHAGCELPPVLGWTALVALAAIAMAGFLAFRVFDAEMLRAFAPAREIFSAAPVLVAFSAACVIHAWYRVPHDLLLPGLIGIAAALGALLLWNQAPLPLLIAYALALLYTVLSPLSFRRLALFALLSSILVVVVLIATLFTLRPSYSNIARDLENREISIGQAGLMQRVLVVAEAKLLQRQAVSAGCYQRIADRSLNEARPGNPFYFVVAIVPKIVWPGKPNLSRGSEFAELCGITGAAAAHHSESITIIGEPILEDGRRGLVAAELTLAALLLGAAWFGLTGGPVRIILLTALLPWLLAVEQHFAMYMGNVFKMTVIILPFALLLHLALRRGQARGPAADDGSPAPMTDMLGDGVAR